MGSIIDLLNTDCQEIHYCYDFDARLKYVFMEKDGKLVEAIRSAKPFDALGSFYWLEDLTNPDYKSVDLRLDAEVIDNDHVLMEIHPGLFRNPEVIDLEAVYFAVVGKDLGPGDFITLGEIGFIWVMAFLKDNLLPRIREDKLRIIDPGLLREDEPEDRKEKAVAAAPKKRAKVRRLAVPPLDVVKEGKRLELWACWLPMYRQLYRRSRFRKLKDVPHYPRETTRKGRYYFCGNEYLARLCGLDERTVRKVLKDLEAENLIYTRYHGFKGRGCSIIELPVNLKLVWKWRRQPGRQKRST